MNADFPKGARFGIAATYRCNMACKLCNRWTDVSSWPGDSDLHVKDLRRAGEIVYEEGIPINKVRITGGEPTLHADLLGICQTVLDVWQPERCTVVLTNGTTKNTRPRYIPGARYKWPSDSHDKSEKHRPFSISPADLGLAGKYGHDIRCETQKGCGLLFDAYGFSFCILAGSMGRVLGVDPYSSRPVVKGMREVCRHCLFSLSRRTRWRVWAQAAAGQLEYPTETYREGFERMKNEPVPFAKREI